MQIIRVFLSIYSFFFLIYLLGYSTYLFFASIVGSIQLHKNNNYRRLRNRLKDKYYVPISLLVPSHNEELTVVETVKSLLKLNYMHYEIIVIDDGSTDNTSKVVIDAFNMIEVKRPINKDLKFKKIKKIYETFNQKVKIVLLVKENGGKSDALNAGICFSSFDYFTCMDADSMLQRDSLEKIARPILEDSRVVACGGIVRISNGAKIVDGYVKDYHLPKGILVSMQVLEYDRTFLASRILFDQFNGNLIISGAFGLFKKDIVISCGGYDTNTVGEDFELVVKLHVFCKMHKKEYLIRYVPDAICWTQAPTTIKSLFNQRKRWNKGLIQVMSKYRILFINPVYGLVSLLSYLYFLIYELLSPIIEFVGIITIILSGMIGALNQLSMAIFGLIYILYSSVLSYSIFISRLHVENIKLSVYDLIKAALLSIVEITFLRMILLTARVASFIGYKKNRRIWERADRIKIDYK